MSNPDLLPEKDFVHLSRVDVTHFVYMNHENKAMNENCRERLARHFTPTSSGFYMGVLEKEIENCPRFMWKVEELLKLKEHSNFAPTKTKGLLWVQPCQWWKDCIMRRSLFTALIRAGIYYDLKKDNFEQSLFSAQYLNSTKRALMRFLFGFTKYVGPELDTNPGSGLIVRGWSEIFSNATDDLVKGYLTWPESDPLKLSVNSLWL